MDVNVDDSCMVYMFSYDDDNIDEEYNYDDEHESLLSNLSPKRTSNTISNNKSNVSRLSNPTSVPILRNESESSVMLFDDDD